MNMIRCFFNKLLPKKSNRRVFVSWVLRHHFYGLLAIIRSIYCTKKLTGRLSPVQCLVYPRIKLYIKVDTTADIQLNGRLHVEPCLASSGISYIEVGGYSKLLIENDFSIGQNIQIIIASNGFLRLGGKEKSSGSGITSDSKILVAEYVEIGEDSIIAWDCLITDSDWHDIDGCTKIKPVHIGKHVWIAHGVSILKGAMISDNSIVAAKSLVLDVYKQPAIMLAGSPTKIIKENISWSR